LLISVCVWLISVCVWLISVCVWLISVCVWLISVCVRLISVCVWLISVCVRLISVCVRLISGDAQLAPAVQFFVSGENTVFLIIIKGAGLHVAMQQAEIEGKQCQAQLVAQRWLSYIADVVRANNQRGEALLIATHRDEALLKGTVGADLAKLQKMCRTLASSYQHAVTLQPEPLFVDALDLTEDRTAVRKSIQDAATAMLEQAPVPKFINTCNDWMEEHAKDPNSAKWTTKEEFKQMPLFSGLKDNQIASGIASLNKLGYIIELPSGHIILKPSWFAAAVSITLSPPPSETDGLTKTVHLNTNPSRPGYIMLNALCSQLLEVRDWKQLQWSADEATALKEARQLVEFLCDIGVVLKDPYPVQVPGSC